MKHKLLLGLILATGSLFAAPRVAVGIGFGAPVPVYGQAYVAPCPGPDYVWIEGRWEHRPQVERRDFDRRDVRGDVRGDLRHDDHRR